MLRITKKSVWENVGLVAFKICLDLIYIFFICDEYGYAMHFKIDFSLPRYLGSWVMWLLIILLTPKKKSIVSYFLVMQMVVTIAPMLTIYGLYNRSGYFMALVCFTHILQCFLCRFLKIHMKVFKIRGSWLQNSVIIFITVASLLWTFLNYGIPSLQALNFSEVYEIRANNKVYGIFNYIIPCFFSVVLPITIIESVRKRKWHTLVLFFGMSLYLYLVYAHKSWFFAALFAMLIYLAVKKELYVKACCVGLPILLGATTLFFEITRKGIMLPSLLVRRIFFVPADIKFEYYSFFSENQKLYFAEGQIGRLLRIVSPYEKNVAIIIGEQLGESGTSCNTGYLADGYAQMGTVGVLLMAVLLVLILKVVDIVSKNGLLALNFGVLSYSLFSLNDSALLTILLTGGLFLSIILLVIRGTSSQMNKELCENG